MSAADASPAGGVEPRPALAHPATRDQQWHVQHLWGLVVVASLAVYPMGYLVASGQLHGATQDLFAVAVVVGWAVPWLLLAWYLDPAVRQRRYLRKYPWVAYPGRVVRTGSRSSLGSALVWFTDDGDRQWAYRVAPNDDDFAEGHRPVWFAGEPGRTAGVVSLRDGACTGMAYRSGNA